MKFGIDGPCMVSAPATACWFRRVDEGARHDHRRAHPVAPDRGAHVPRGRRGRHNVRVMSNIMIAMHPPLLLAKRIASIDVISGGRFMASEPGAAPTTPPLASRTSNRWKQMTPLRSCATSGAEHHGLSESRDCRAPPFHPAGRPSTTASGPTALPRATKWANDSSQHDPADRHDEGRGPSPPMPGEGRRSSGPTS